MSAFAKPLVERDASHPQGAIAQPVPPTFAGLESAAAGSADASHATHSIWPVILWVTVPFWLLMTATRVSSYMVRVATIPEVKVAEPLERILQHAMLFGVLVLFYRLAFAIGWPRERRWLAAIGQLSLAAVFAFLATPVLTFAIDLISPEMNWLAEMAAGEGAIVEQIHEWASSGVLAVSVPDFFLSYWFGLLLVFGARTHLDLRDHKLRLVQLEGETVRARLQALRMQLHPHFLFNTLHSISGLIDSRPAVARQIIVRLGDLLRRTLRDGGSDLLPLSREIDFVRNYLEIQQLRFPDRLRFTIRIEPAVAEAMVPGLILQPLAENAVVHGASEEDERVHVTIDARQVIDSSRLTRWLELSVHNTGNAHAEGAGSGSHIGIGNTRERLRALYGGQCSVEFSEPAEGGFLARLRIPLHEGVETWTAP
jgi:hypothetical protein